MSMEEFHKEKTKYDNSMKENLVSELREFWDGNEGRLLRNLKWALLAVVGGSVAVGVINIFAPAWLGWTVGSIIFATFISMFAVKTTVLAKELNVEYKAKQEEMDPVVVYARMTQFKETEEEAVAHIKAQRERKKKESEAKREERRAMRRSKDNRMSRILVANDKRVEKKNGKADQKAMKVSEKTTAKIQKHKAKSNKAEDKELIGA